VIINSEFLQKPAATIVVKSCRWYQRRSKAAGRMTA